MDCRFELSHGGLSILSRFYFYSKPKPTATESTPSFNPIKVLFLHGCVCKSITVTIDFQSYQGSIFTTLQMSEQIKLLLTFNPIKVLFLPKGVYILYYYFTIFQSYQGSIFTLIYRTSAFTTIPLSILSRFYFYEGGGWVLPGYTSDFQSYQGSIFTKTPENEAVRRAENFQSYQGSIFTVFHKWLKENKDNFQSYQGSIFTEYYFVEIIQDSILSILSRFYFYRSLLFLTVGMLLSFNPIKVLFLPDTP